MPLLNNTPAAGSISWTGLTVVAADGTPYAISDDHTALHYVVWERAHPTVVRATDNIAELNDHDQIVFYNADGLAELVASPAPRIHAGWQIAPLTISETHIADHSISTQKLQAGAVLTSQLEVQLRPIDFVGVTFGTAGSNSNVMIWTSITPNSMPITYGTATYDDAAGDAKVVLIKPNLTGVAYAGAPVYVYFDPTATYTDTQGRQVNELKTTTERLLARNKSIYADGSNILMAAFHGNGQIISVFGGVTISGDTITAGTIKGDRIIAGEILAQHLRSRQVFVDHDLQVGDGAQRVRVFASLPEFETTTWVDAIDGIAAFSGQPCVLVGDPEDPVQRSTVYIGLDEGLQSNGTPVPVIWFGSGGGVERLRIGKLNATDFGMRVKTRPFGTEQYTLFDTTDTLSSLWPNDFSVNGNVSAWADKTVLGKYASGNANYVSNYALSLSAGWMSDVVISNPTEGQILKFVSGKWRNVNP